MNPMQFAPLFGLVYIIIAIVPIVLILIAIFRFLDIKREQNDLLREIIKRLDVK